MELGTWTTKEVTIRSRGLGRSISDVTMIEIRDIGDAFQSIRLRRRLLGTHHMDGLIWIGRTRGML